MRRCFRLSLLLLAWLAQTALAGESAVTIRATELKKEPYADAATIATVPEQTRVEIVQRQGAWTRIKPPSAGQGWVRMMSLRLGSGQAKQGDSGLGALLSLGRTGSSGVTVSTGVRGLSEEDLRHAQPNPQELQKMQRFATTPQEATRFGAQGNLRSQKVDYLPAPAAAPAPAGGPSPEIP